MQTRCNVCNNKQRWDNYKCKCEFKQLIYKGIYDKRFIWSPSSCEYECDKSCDVGEYLNFENCKFRKTLIDKLVEECSENTDGNEMTNVTLNKHKNVRRSCTIYIVLFSHIFVVNLSISSVFIYFYWYLKRDTNITNIISSTKTTIYETYKWKISSKFILIVHIPFLMI